MGGQIPLGTGLAFAQKYLGTNRVTLAYMGDGAINQGAVHEAMNLAALWKLPIIYIIENNEYSMGTSIARSSAGDPLTKRAGAFDMAAIQANGMDVDDVRAKTFEAVSLARTESLPTLMEIRDVSVLLGHSMSDPGHYRSKEEIEARKGADPIENYKARLIEQKVATEESLNAIDEEAHTIMRRPHTILRNRAPSPRSRRCTRIFLRRKTKLPSSGPISAVEARCFRLLQNALTNWS